VGECVARDDDALLKTQNRVVNVLLQGRCSSFVKPPKAEEMDSNRVKAID